MSFDLDFSKFIKETDEVASKIIRGTALAMFSSIVKRTPVGNPDNWKVPYKPKDYVGGRLRGNWQLTLNKAANNEVNATDDSGRETIAAGVVAASGSKIKDTIYLANNLPYAESVEDGSSTQAPSGMVKVTLDSFEREIRKNARKHGNT